MSFHHTSDSEEFSSAHDLSSSANEPHNLANPMENIRELAQIPAIEIISRSAIILMSAAAEKLGLAETDPNESSSFDLDEARRLITALAGLIMSSVEYLGPHAAPFRDGLQSLQKAFREASTFPDGPGLGPGEKYTGTVH